MTSTPNDAKKKITLLLITAAIIIIIMISIVVSGLNKPLIQRIEGVWERPISSNSTLRLTIYATGENTFCMREDFLNPYLAGSTIRFMEEDDYSIISDTSFVKTEEIDRKWRTEYSIKVINNHLYLINHYICEDDEAWTKQ